MYHSSGVAMLPPCFPQSKAVLCVFKGFLGTPSVLSLLTFSSIFGSANLQHEELVGGLEEKLVGRRWRSGFGLDEREELETALLGTFEAEPEALLEAAACFAIECLKL